MRSGWAGVTITDSAVLAIFKDYLFYSAGYRKKSATESGKPEHLASLYLAVKRDGSVQVLPDQKAMAAFFLAHVRPLTVPPEHPLLLLKNITPATQDCATCSALRYCALIEPAPAPDCAPTLDSAPMHKAPIQLATCAWARLSELYVSGVYLAFKAEQVDVHIENPVTALREGIGANPRSWLVGTLEAFPARDSGLTGTYDVELYYDITSGKLLDATSVNFIGVHGDAF